MRANRPGSARNARTIGVEVHLFPPDNVCVLKGSRDAVLRRVQPISIHGQLSYDLHYVFADEPDGHVRVARVGPEAMAPGLQAGDSVRLDFLVGVVTAVRRSGATA